MSERKIVYGTHGKAHYTTGYYPKGFRVWAYCGVVFDTWHDAKVTESTELPLCKRCERIAKARAAHGRKNSESA